MSLTLASRTPSSAGGAGGGDSPPGRPLVDLAIAEALRGVAAALGEIVARVIAHADASAERHAATQAELVRLQAQLDRLLHAPGDRAEALRRADEEASLARARAAAETAAAAQVAEAQEAAQAARQELAEARAQLQTARARQSVTRAAWGLAGDLLRSAGRWASSPDGRTALGVLAGAVVSAIVHYLLTLSGGSP